MGSGMVSLNTSWARDQLRPPHRKLASHLPLPLRRKYLYAAAMRRPGNFRHPKTYNEKVNWRILNDRRPQIVDACDKMRQKEIARERLDESRLRIPRTLWSGTDLDDVPAELWQGEWVLKPNNGSGDVIFSPFTSLADLKELTKHWLSDTQFRDLGEWGYSQARHLIVLEERIPGPSAPIDYKVITFDGEPQVIPVHQGRFGSSHTRTYLDTDWNQFPVHTTHQASAPAERPENLDDMLEVARVLARDWEFIRLDLYSVDGEVWLGEYSPYPCGGSPGSFRSPSTPGWAPSGPSLRWNRCRPATSARVLDQVLPTRQTRKRARPCGHARDERPYALFS